MLTAIVTPWLIAELRNGLPPPPPPLPSLPPIHPLMSDNNEDFWVILEDWIRLNTPVFWRNKYEYAARLSEALKLGPLRLVRHILEILQSKLFKRV